MDRTLIIHQNWRIIETIDSHRYYFEDRSESDSEPALIVCKEVHAKVNQQKPELWNEDDFSQLYDKLVANEYYDVIKNWGTDERVIKDLSTSKISISKANYINRIKEILYEDLTQLASGRFATFASSKICHIIRASEVEKFYEYTSSVVINGIECDKFEDAGTVYCDYNYGYIDVLYSGKYEEITGKIPESDLKEVNIRMDSGRYYERKKLIPKKYIDKIILRRKYLHPDCIEFSLEKFYTGEEDVFELDPKNLDPKVLNLMIEYRVVHFYVDDKRDTIKPISNKKILTIGGNEYDDVRNNGGTIVLCHDLMAGYDLGSESDVRKLYNDLKSNSFVHGLCKDSLYKNLSMEDYMTLMQNAKKEAEAKNVPLHQVICPFHRVRQSEVEAFCEYESSIVLGKWYDEESWVECKKFLDLNCLQPGYSETYPEYVSVDAESSEILCKTLDSWQQKKITINDLENNNTREMTTFKKCTLQQIKLYRRYLDTSDIEHSLEAPYTGKEEVFVLNMDKIYPKDLELMRKYGVIVENELK